MGKECNWQIHVRHPLLVSCPTPQNLSPSSSPCPQSLSENGSIYFSPPARGCPSHCSIIHNIPWPFPGILTWRQHHPSAVLLDAVQPSQHPFPRVSLKGSEHCTTPGGTVIKCGMCFPSRFPECRSEASRPFAREQALSGHLLWGRRENEVGMGQSTGSPLRRMFIIPL